MDRDMLHDEIHRTGQPMDRREFLAMSATGMIGAGLSASLPAALSDSVKRGKIAVQLYTVRNEIKKDMPGTLKKLANIGFSKVETAFWPEGVTLEQASIALQAAGLHAISSHVELPVGVNHDLFLETARVFNSSRVIWHGWPEDKRYSSLEGTKELVAIYNETGRIARSNGLQFGIHNHWWEFRNKVGGRFVYEVLLDSLDPEIFFEIDTYWVKVAGHNPAEIVAKFGSRAPLLHIKDGPARWNESLAEDNPDPMTPVGKGTQDFPAIVKAAAGNTQFMIVEMDKTVGDVFDTLRESYDYLVKNSLALSK